MSRVRHSLIVALTVGFLTSFASAQQVLFSDRGESSANFTVVQDPDTTVEFNVDYAALGIPEAPRTSTLPGSAVQRGIQITANKGDDAAATATAANLILGSTPQNFAGVHTLQYDVWMNVGGSSTSTTEGFLGGVARSTSNSAIYRNFRTGRGNGAWFYATGDNGNATDDYAQLNNGARDVVFADTTNAESTAKFNNAFDNSLSGVNDDAANEWVRVRVVNNGSTASVFFDDVLFSTNAVTNTGGFAWFGYEDMFGSVADAGIYGVFDNVVVTNVPEPTALAALPVVGLLLGRRGRRGRTA
ncbi:MAG: hypothetical protein AVDCRST_MAG64-4517 [uncultured Phycisphaerae bacterium]|uniref:PEP-CTERM protein-sorting domain-containing protein n=1 Tax=uncultured Phycisphaerae bacterium TaxID=904963 RepID=A0A6J4QLL4_9BACT|nr:MAG: hypothetical protein AVDCRST_MAG64-4517 [uncultured Phycisphaerae bacterium]